MTDEAIKVSVTLKRPPLEEWANTGSLWRRVPADGCYAAYDITQQDALCRTIRYTLALEQVLAEVTRERDLAIAHDRQPYPTAWAYEQACKALENAKAEVARLREDGERWQYARNNGTWRRGDDPHDGAYTEWAIRVAPGANLSCAVMVDHAIDAARSARGGEG